MSRKPTAAARRSTTPTTTVRMDKTPAVPARSSTVRLALTALALVRTASPGVLTVHVVCTLATGVMPVVIAWLTKLVIDQLTTAGSMSTLLGLAGGLAAAGVVMGVLPQVCVFLRTELDRKVGLLTQDRLFTAVDGFQGLRRFEDPHFLDRLRLAQQPGTLSPHPNQAVEGTLGVARSAFTIAGLLGSLSLLSPVMTLLVLAAGAPTLLAEIALSRRRARMHWELGPVERREFFYSHLLSSVEAAKEVRLFGIGAFLRDRMLADRRTANAAKRALDRRELRVQGGLGLLAAAVSGGGLIWAASAARSGELSVGGVSMFVAAVAGVQAALATMAGEVARCHQALLMFDHYSAVTTAPPDLPASTAAPAARAGELPPLRRGIELRDVWFRYSEQHPWVLRGVDLFIPCGASVALVGLNGAGKSTLVKLLCRFYDPERGAVLWDGLDLRQVDVVQLRRRIGAVFQDYMHYDMTAAENIGLGDLDALHDRERLSAAAHRAGIHDVLAGLPRGYDTLLSRMFYMESDKNDPDTGVVLSGGQWQRVALARGLLCDRRDVLVLDEPSAGLDAEAEHEIHASIRQLRSGRTSVLISHRLSAVREADIIVVLSEGRVVESGDHRTLMAADGAYARLFTLQGAGYQPDATAVSVRGERP